MTRPIVYLDDNRVDLQLMHSCHGMAECSSPLVTMLLPQELFDYMRSADSGEAARPELLLIDIRMPTMSGFDVVEQLQRDAGEPLPRLVFFSTSGRDEDARRAQELGGRLVRKPSDIDDYVALLENGFRP